MPRKVERIYDFLIADPSKDSRYTEGNEVEGERIHGTSEEMEGRLRALFRDPPVTRYVSLSHRPVWDVDGAEVFFLSRRDLASPYNAECFGHLVVKGEMVVVDSIDTRVTERFPGIDKHVTDTETD
ncbi:MAG: hypothetical protein KKD17_05335 [Nanoarchaeota archaeon]|nr:hypothetical protein [Nanoarchaeota archaeon]